MALPTKTESLDAFDHALRSMFEDTDTTTPKPSFPWRFLLGTIGFLIVVLTVLNIALAALRLADFSTPVLPGQLMYITTFDAYNSQWSEVRDASAQAVIHNSALNLQFDAPDRSAYATLDRTFGSFDIRLDSTWRSGPMAYGQIGLRYRVQDSGDYYEFSIDTRGAYRVEMVRDGGKTHEILSDWQRSTHILTGLNETNQLRVMARNYVFEFYVNDQQLPLCLRGNDARPAWTDFYSGQCKTNRGQVRQEMVEQTYGSGKIAVGGENTDRAGFRAQIDNVLVYGPR